MCYCHHCLLIVFVAGMFVWLGHRIGIPLIPRALLLDLTSWFGLNTRVTPEIATELNNLLFRMDYKCVNMERFPMDMPDGAYTFCDDTLQKVPTNGCVVFSYGISDNDGFDRELHRRWGCEVHQFDPTVFGSIGANESSSIHFHKEGLSSSKSEDSNLSFDTLESHYHQYAKAGHGPFILKIDVDGMEYPSLKEVPSSVWQHVDLLNVELHGLAWWPKTAVETLRKLRLHFLLYHAFSNPCCRYAWGMKWRLPRCVELSFVRRDLVSASSHTSLQPLLLPDASLDPTKSACNWWPALPADTFFATANPPWWVALHAGLVLTISAGVIAIGFAMFHAHRKSA